MYCTGERSHGRANGGLRGRIGGLILGSKCGLAEEDHGLCKSTSGAGCAVNRKVVTVFANIGPSRAVLLLLLAASLLQRGNALAIQAGYSRAVMRASRG